jgi:hypothetical protein
MATTNLKPDSDVTADWDTTTGANHFGEIDEGSPYGDADYIETVTINDIDEFTMEDTPANTSEVTQIDINCRGQIDDASATARIQFDLFHSAGTPVSGNPKYADGVAFGGYGVLGEITPLSWTTLTLTKTEADSLQCRITFLAS